MRRAAPTTLLIWIVLAGTAFARTADESFVRGLQALDKGRPGSAARHFEACRREGVADPAVSSYDAVEARRYLTDRFARQALDGNAPGFRPARYEAALHARALNRLGNIAWEAGELDAAQARYQEAVRRDPDYPMAHCNLGRLLVERKRYREGIERCETAYRLSPTYDYYRRQLAAMITRAAAEQRREGLIDRDEAHAAFERSIGLDAAQDLAYIEYGASLYETGDRLKGLFLLERATRVGESSARACRVYAAYLVRDGQYEQARSFAQRAVDLAGSSAAAHRILGDALYHLRRYDEAIETLYRAAPLDPEDPITLRLLGKTYERLGMYDPALRTLDRAAALAPDDAEIRYRLGRVHLALGDLPRAKRLIEDARAAAPRARWAAAAGEAAARIAAILDGIPPVAPTETH